MLNLREHPADGKLGWLLLWLRLRPARARSHAGQPPGPVAGVCTCGEGIHWRASPGAWFSGNGLMVCAQTGPRVGAGRVICHHPAAVMQMPPRVMTEEKRSR